MFLKNFNNTPVKAPTTPKNATAHNSIYRGKNIGLKYSIDEICSMISSGKFDDIFIGDYFDIEITINENKEKLRCIIAGLDTYLRKGDTAMMNHHAQIVLKNTVNTQHRMNESNTTTGGFSGSEMFTTTLPLYNAAISEVLGEHLLTYRDALTGTNAWHDVQLNLLTQLAIFGYDHISNSNNDIGIVNSQLPLFRLNPALAICKKGGIDDVAANNREWYWLRNIQSGANFANISLDGSVGMTPASATRGLRPTFLIG